MKRRWSLAVVTVIGVFSLACSGLEDPEDPLFQDPEEMPEPEPEPAPDPAPNADKCAKFQGVKVPMKDGVIVGCNKKSVTISHVGTEASEKRWEYADLYKKKGWSQGDPQKGSPTVVKYPESLVFRANGDEVVIELQK